MILLLTNPVDAGGYSFLDSLLTMSNSISAPAKRHKAYLAPAPQLALASTLIVYPAVTTQARSSDKVKGANAALRYLRNVQSTISPTHESLRNAFAFPDERLGRRTAGNRAGNTSPTPPIDAERLTGIVAKEQALWYRARDFWHIVGWAFNCSVVYKRRWERWKLWLDLMLDFLEADWGARLQAAKEGADAEKMLTESLIWQYISSEDPTNRSNRRRMMRAIMAMGTSQAKTDFPEVWGNETAGPRTPEPEEKPLAEMDIENGELGEFKQDDEDAVMQDAPTLPTWRSGRAGSRKAATTDGADGIIKDEDVFVIRNTEEAIERLGGIDAINLRQRLVALLAQVAQTLPAHFTKLGDYFDSLTEEFRLPTIIFSILLSTSKLPDRTKISLSANLLLPFVTTRLPDYTSIEPIQSHFEEYILPRRATTQSYAANAKISLILEQMFMYMMSINSLEATDALREAVEIGVEERQSVYGTGGGKKGNAHEENQAKGIMSASSQRLLGLLEVLEIAAGKEPQPQPRGVERETTINLSQMSSLSDLSSPPESSSEE